MATEEVNKPPSLPQYSEMILQAIDALNDQNGSNKSAISKYIESTYGDLPAGHANLLSHHLNRMKESGDLLLVKNNYLRPGPDAPPKRGRGRPLNPKPPSPSTPSFPRRGPAAGLPRTPWPLRPRRPPRLLPVGCQGPGVVLLRRGEALRGRAGNSRWGRQEGPREAAEGEGAVAFCGGWV